MVVRDLFIRQHSLLYTSRVYLSLATLAHMAETLAEMISNVLNRTMKNHVFHLCCKEKILEHT